jgi:hypothetical protein
MTYSRYAIQRRFRVMLQEIGWLILVGAVLVAAVTTWLEFSPWRILALAGIATVLTVVLATVVAGEPCGVSTTTGDLFFEITVMSSVTLYGAAALGGVVDGVRLGRAGDGAGAMARIVGIPLAGAAGVGIVFLAFVGAIAHCLD